MRGLRNWIKKVKTIINVNPFQPNKCDKYNLGQFPDSAELTTIRANDEYIKAREYWSTILGYTTSRSGKTTTNSCQSNFKMSRLAESYVPEPSLAPDRKTLAKFMNKVKALGVSDEIVGKTRTMVEDRWDK